MNLRQSRKIIKRSIDGRPAHNHQFEQAVARIVKHNKNKRRQNESQHKQSTL